MASDTATEIMNKMGIPVPPKRQPGTNENLPATENLPAAETPENKDAGESSDNANNSIGENGENGENKNNNAVQKGEQKNEQPVAPEITEDAVLEFLRKRGQDINSLDDIKPTKELTPEERETAEKDEQNNIASYAIQNKIYDANTLKVYGTDQARTPRDIAMEIFTSIQQAANPGVTPEQIETRFIEHFAEGELTEDGETPSWRATHMQTQMELMKQQYLKNKYEPILNAPNLYRDHVRVEQAARDYSKEVNAQFAGLPAEMTFEVDGKSYKFKPHPETVTSVKEQFLNNAQFEIFGQKVPDKNLLQSSINNAIQMADLNRIVDTVSKAHAAEVLLAEKAGRKNAITREETNSAVGTPSNQGSAADILNNLNN